MMQLSFYATLEEVRAAALMCRGCGRSSRRRQVVFGHGDPAAALAIIAEYPSQTDDRTGIPFTGPAGDLLDELLGEAGVTQNQVWITNLVRCYATETGRAGDRIKASTARERAACQTWTDFKMQFVDPKVILALGAPAATMLIRSNVQLTEERGVWHRRPDSRWVIATFQPA